ncbi:MAG: TIGR00730 family Rossman fold protein [bacterium]|nr:TIGR00730 family Rossman fold protein [bacterium]
MKKKIKKFLLGNKQLPPKLVGETLRSGKHFEHWLCNPSGECEQEEEESFTDDPQWRILRIMAEFIEGFEFLSKLKKEVTFFGSARAKGGTFAYDEARKLGKMLGKRGYTVITGGGPGVMEAGNRGAKEGGGGSIGLDIELLTKQRRNKYVERAIGFHYFFTRKVMLSASAQAYIFFPGGFGTLDEMFEMLTLIQTGKITQDIPLILVGKEYWEPLLKWIMKEVVGTRGFVDKKEFEIIQLVSSAEGAFEIIEKTVERKFG